MNAYIKNTEISQINDLMLYLKLQEKQQEAKSKTSRTREIIKIKAKNNKIDPPKKRYKDSAKQKASSLKR
jgi:hypothetical protein